MKKTNYLNYLNEYNQNLPTEVQKTFKNLKKNPKTKFNKIVKNKDCYMKPQNVPYLSISKRTQNKENINPNVAIQSMKDDKMMKKSQSIFLKIQKQRQSFEKQQNKEKNKEIERRKSKSHKIQVSLTKCNFQPSHSSENLYLVETQTSKQIIVCQKCSQMFSKRIKISDLKKNIKSNHSYSQLVSLYEFYEQENKKLRRIQLIEKQNLQKNINKVSSYYDSLIEKLSDLENEVQKSIFQVYQKNSVTVNGMIEKNITTLRILDERIQSMQKGCIDSIALSSSYFQKSDLILLPKAQNKILQLGSFDIVIPHQIVEYFQKQFTTSIFCIKLGQYQKSQKVQNPALNNQSERFKENEKILEQDDEQKESQKIEAFKQQSVNFENELPFKVDFSMNESKSVNFSHKMEDILSKISSSEQLLIQSLREHSQRQSIPIMVKNGAKQLCQEQKDNLHNFKTQASTYRPQREVRQQQENQENRKNFIKELHNLQSEEINDMICDEELSLSYSHPIYENHPIQPRKSLKLVKKSSKNNIALSLSQLQSQMGDQQQKRQSTINSQIINPSIITASQNKQDISFELDENIIIDANILPQENQGYQNLDIISPAFKII